MGIAYAATEGGGHHGEEHSIGETILHHVQDTHVFDLWPLGHVNLPEIHLFGIDFSITKHLVMMWIASILLIAVLSARFSAAQAAVPSGMANMFEALVVFFAGRGHLAEYGRGGPALPAVSC